MGEVKQRAEFLKLFEQIERASTRDEVREGWVIEDCKGELHKYKSKTWLRWSEVPMVDERNVEKAVKSMLNLGKQCRAQTDEAMRDYIFNHFAHLSKQQFKDDFPQLVASEQAKLQLLMTRAGAAWDEQLLALTPQLESAAGGP